MAYQYIHNYLISSIYWYRYRAFQYNAHPQYPHMVDTIVICWEGVHYNMQRASCMQYALCTVHICMLNSAQIVEGNAHLTRPALRSCHTSQRVTCLLSSSYASHVTCASCVTQILHISCLTSWKLKFTITMCYTLSCFQFQYLSYVCLDIMSNPNFLFLEQNLQRIIGAVT